MDDRMGDNYGETGTDMADRNCGCKGIRSCLLCENVVFGNTEDIKSQENHSVYFYCVECKKAFLEFDHLGHATEEGIHFPGISIFPNFITTDEEQGLCQQIYETPFIVSQSGRRKQDFGPKVNFKKKKLRVEKFTGLPTYARTIVDKMHSLPQLQDFQPVELCNLEYRSERGAAIDPHFDDFWLWGDRLVTLNLLSNSILSFTKDSDSSVEVQVPLFQRSLITVFGEARNVWKHGIHRHHITNTRIAMTFRELTSEFLDGGDRASDGKKLLAIALTFDGCAVGL